MVKLLSEYWIEILRRVKRENPGLDPLSHKFKIVIAEACELVDLPTRQVKEMMLNFGHYFCRTPPGIPDHWNLVWCKSFLSPKYCNPDDPYEYVTVVPEVRRGHLPYVIHHSSQGFADRRWFLEIIPQLETILKDPTIGKPFSFKFNEAINALFGDKMTPGQVAALNIFFGKFVPGVEGICTKCYYVTLPRSGSGESWRNRENPDFEVRLSAAKPNGREGQRYKYVSHTEVDQSGNESYATWNPITLQAGFDPDMVQRNTHIPWEVYDFEKFSFRMPRCRCDRKLGD